jgi:RND family efflux transporter MFP subunit
MKNYSNICLIVIATALAGCSKPPQQGAQQPPLKVTVVQPKVMSVTNWDEYPAHVEAVDMVEIRPRVSGYIDSIQFTDGAEVKAGDPLFVIDPKPLQADLDRAMAERKRVNTRLELAQNDLKRAEELRGTRAISAEEYDSRNKAVSEATAALDSVKASEAAAELNLGYSQVKAPIAGRIGRRLVTVGNLVQGGGAAPATVLATLVSMDPVYCYFDVQEDAFLRYRAAGYSGAGTKDGALVCELALVNEQDFPHKGRIDFFDNQVNAKSGTIRLRGVFANSDRALVPGMFANVRVPAGPVVQAMVIPAVAVTSDQDQKYVLVANKSNMIERKDIKVGRQHGAMRVVIEGLTLEDRVITTGLLMARVGIPVDTGAPSAPPAAQK